VRSDSAAGGVSHNRAAAAAAMPPTATDASEAAIPTFATVRQSIPGATTGAAGWPTAGFATL
jgi:hypothetical protein